MLKNILFLNLLFFISFNGYLCNEVISKCIFPQHKLLPRGINLIKIVEGEVYEAKDDNGTYQYTVTICTTNNVTKNNINLKFAAVIQQDVKNKNIPPVVIGRYNNTDIKMGTNWGFLEFGSGDTYSSECAQSNRVAMLMMTCNADITKPILRIIEENSLKNRKCYYLFELEHPKLCKSNNNLGSGAIVMIVLVTLVAVYICIGMAIKKVFFNASGADLVPNITFWRCIGQIFTNCIENLCPPKPSNEDRSRYQPREWGDHVSNSSRTDHADDDEQLIP